MAENDTETTPVRRAGSSPFRDHDDVDDLLTEPHHAPAPLDERPAGPQRLLVVGTDGSAASRAALDWAIRNAQHDGATVRVVAAWYQPVQFGDAPPVPAAEFEEEARTWLDEALPAPTAAQAEGALVETRLEQAEPAAALLRHAQRADLLVLGNRGHGALVGAMLGSVALRCVQRARCPVVLVPTPPS
jgi:nucleotide-binding universal stress UspA family protein